jgi:hypothetical protein
MDRKSKSRSNAGARRIPAQLADLSTLMPEVMARRTLRVARVGPWSAQGRAEMNGMVAEKALASMQSGFAMWTAMFAAAQRAWLDALGGTFWFGGAGGRAVPRPSAFDVGADVLAQGIEPLRRKTRSNAKRLRRRP